MSGMTLQTEAALAAHVEALPGRARAIFDHLAQHHFLSATQIAKALKVSAHDVDTTLRGLAGFGLVEGVTKAGHGVLWRPSPCLVEEKVKPGERPAPEPEPWTASELQGALQDGRHPLHVEARALFVDALAGLDPQALASIVDEARRRQGAPADSNSEAE